MAGLETLLPLPDRAGFARRVERRLRQQDIVGPIEFDRAAFALRWMDGASQRTLNLRAAAPAGEQEGTAPVEMR